MHKSFKRSFVSLIIAALIFMIVPVILANSYTNNNAAGVDNGTLVRSVDVSGLGPVEEVIISVNFEIISGGVASSCDDPCQEPGPDIDISSCDGPCPPLPPVPPPLPPRFSDATTTCLDIGHDGGNPFNDEFSLVLVSPQGTSVSLVNDYESGETYSSANEYGGRVNVLFDDNAPMAVGGSSPVSVRFRPEEPLSTFMGEDPNGTWSLIIGDNFGGDPVCFYSYTLVINPPDDFCISSNYPVLGSVEVVQSVVGYGQPGIDMIRDENGAPLEVFNNAAGDGRDEYLILAIDSYNDEIWYGLFLGGCDPVWVNGNLVTRIR